MRCPSCDHDNRVDGEHPAFETARPPIETPSAQATIRFQVPAHALQPIVGVLWPAAHRACCRVAART